MLVLSVSSRALGRQSIIVGIALLISLITRSVQSTGTIQLLKLQHENSDCTDLHDLIEFKRTYNISKALANAAAFFQVKEDVNGEHRFKVTYSCQRMFKEKEEKTIVWPPPRRADLMDDNATYLNDLMLNDPKIYMSDFYCEEQQNGGQGYVWTEQEINALAAKPSICGGYAQSHCEACFNKYEAFVRGKVGMIVGSQSPWAEALSFRYGAAKVITYEYMRIKTTHPKLVTVTPAEAAALYLAGKLEPVDFVFSFSSLEHDGLGRYGDPLNAFGDFESLAKIHCMLKPNGILFLGLPLSYDEIQYNAHRLYGYRRLSVVLALGFRLVDFVNDRRFKIDMYNGYLVTPVMVLQKRELH